MKRNGWRYTPFSLAGWVLVLSAIGMTLIWVGALGDNLWLKPIGLFVTVVGQLTLLNRRPRVWLKERVYASGAD